MHQNMPATQCILISNKKAKVGEINSTLAFYFKILSILRQFITILGITISNINKHLNRNLSQVRCFIDIAFDRDSLSAFI